MARIYRVSAVFISVLQDFIPEVTSAHKCHTNIDPMLKVKELRISEIQDLCVLHLKFVGEV